MTEGVTEGTVSHVCLTEAEGDVTRLALVTRSDVVTLNVRVRELATKVKRGAAATLEVVNTTRA